MNLLFENQIVAFFSFLLGLREHVSETIFISFTLQ